MSRSRHIGVVAAACAATLAFTACGSDEPSGGSGPSGGLPATVTVPAVISLTGAAGLAGGQIADGMKFAVAEINQKKFLGDSTLEITFNDDQTNSERVVRLMTDAVRSDAPAVFGPPISAFGLATAPIAQQGKLPDVISQSVTSGLNDLLQQPGSYIFRLTAPQTKYQQPTVDYLVAKGVKTATLLHIQEGEANKEWATKAVPDLLKTAGIQVTDTVAFPQAQTDFSALATRIAQAKPDAVGMSTFQTQNSTLVSQLRQAGYEGIIFGDTSFGGNSLQGAGAAANGCIWSADFAPFITAPQSSVDFITAWKAAKSADPLSFNAEGHDAVWFLARALKNAQSLDRDKVRDAMEAITKEGMPAAVGDLTFVGHDAKVPGVLNQWLDGKPAEVAGQ